MLCPFCQYELDIDDMSCTNCAAVFPRRGLSLSVRVRTVALSGAMLLVGAAMLSDCVLNYLPGGPDSGYKAPDSPQAAIGPGPDMKSPQVQAMLQSWMHNQQLSENPGVGLAKH